MAPFGPRQVYLVGSDGSRTISSLVVVAIVSVALTGLTGLAGLTGLTGLGVGCFCTTLFCSSSVLVLF